MTSLNDPCGLCLKHNVEVIMTLQINAIIKVMGFIFWVLWCGLPFLGDPYEFVRKISTILLQNYTVVVVGMKEYTLVRGDGGRRAYISISIIQDQLKLAGLVVVMDRYYI